MSPQSTHLRQTRSGLAFAGLLAVLAVAGVAHAQAVPSGCESIASIPARFAIDYAVDIQPLFDVGCQNCHVNHAGNPLSNLDLDPEPSWFNLVGVPSSQAGGVLRVKPGDALASLLFTKFNCETPGPFTFSERMPLGRPPRPLSEQALIYDWIMAGAPFEPTDTIFFDGLERRGFGP